MPPAGAAEPVFTLGLSGILKAPVPFVLGFLAFLDLAALTLGLISVSTATGSGKGGAGGAGGGGGGAKGGGGGMFTVPPPKHIRFRPP